MDCETETNRLTVRQRLKPKLEITVLCVAIGVAWGLLSLPVVIYHLPNWEQGSALSEVEANCSVLAQTVDTCSPTEVYVGQTCRQYLSAFQNCLNFGGDDIYIAPQSDQSSTEKQAMAVVGTGLQFVDSSSECEEMIKPFLCLYMFQLCDGDGQVYKPTCGLCVSIRDDTCVREWNKANELLQTALFDFEPLPVCEKLPGQCYGLNAKESINDTLRFSSSSSNETEVQVRNCSTIQCQKGFYCTIDVTLNTSICRPRCDTWKELPHFANVASDVVVIFCSLVSIIASTTLIVMSVIQSRRMFRFPSVFVVYIAITGIIFALFILISYVDRPGLYCSSLDLEESVQNPSAFCTTSGIVVQYALLQITLWWFIHLTAFFWKVMFPFHAKRCEEHHLKYAHIAGVLIALLVPLVPVAVTATNGGFAITRFPPIVCTNSTAAPAFYSHVIVIVVLVQTGITMLIIVLWKIHKQKGLSREIHSTTVSKQVFRFGSAEKKLLLIFLYYVLLGVVALTAFTWTTKNVENYNKQLMQYFQCEAYGVDPNNPCDTTTFVAFMYIELVDALAYVLLALLPAVSLIYVVDVKELKRTSCSTTCLLGFRMRIKALRSSFLSSLPPEKGNSST